MLRQGRTVRRKDPTLEEFRDLQQRDDVGSLRVREE